MSGQLPDLGLCKDCRSIVEYTIYGLNCVLEPQRESTEANAGYQIN
jgi:hypothetical protein